MSYPVISRVAGYCCEAENKKEDAHVQSTRGGERPSGKEEGISGEYWCYYQPGLTKDDKEEDKIGPDAIILDDDSEMSVQVNKDIEECLDQFHTVSNILQCIPT